MTSDLLVKLDVSRETFQRLEAYAALLEKWNPRINLVSAGTMNALWTRHFLDSAQLFRFGLNADHWVDLGSGGGFPGAVIAIMAHELAPEMRLTLIEADRRKAAFLRAVARETRVTFEVICERVEAVPPLGADVVSARALASLDLLLGLANRHLRPGGMALFPKGARADDEIKDALEEWRFDCEKHPSATDVTASILELGAIQRV